MKKPTCTLYGGQPAVRKCARRFFSFIPQEKRKNYKLNSCNLISYHFRTKSKGKQP